MKGRKLLMIPGPIEFDPAVLQAMSIPTTSHVAPNFIASFGHALDMMKEVWLCPSGQAFVVAGSGTLAMDIAAANLIEPGDKALVVSTGYFGERYADILGRYGAEIDILRADVGEIVPLETIEAKLQQKNYKLLTFTHVDTSTGVLNDPRPFGELGKKYDVLTILDGVCSVAGEEIRQEEWNIDVALTASQKAVGVPPGLALLVASPKAMDTWKNRKYPVPNYYADFKNWLPIMEAYQSRKPSYFGTPPVNLILALETSLQLILNDGMEFRFAKHRKLAKAFRESMQAMGLELFPQRNEIAANTLSAVYYPKGIDGNSFRKEINRQGVIVAGGLLKEKKTEYFRVGHMGEINQNDLVSTVSAIENALKSCGHSFEFGIGIKTALELLS